MSVYPDGVEIRSHAVISADGKYRYSLIREWGPGALLTFVMLNPSTADADQDDPTIRRCVGFGRSLGYDGINVVNLYAFRATKPADLWKAADPVGPMNDQILEEVVKHRGQVIAAWGANAKPERVKQVTSLPGWSSLTISTLGVTKHGAPRHPLYVPAAEQPRPLYSRHHLANGDPHD